MSYPTLHLRAETKPLEPEHRSALTPTTTKALLDAGYPVNVERSKLRIFDDQEFADVGATLVPEGSWPDAPDHHIIIGLKELPEETFPLKHTHVQFAHCYKNQGGWAEVLSRYTRDPASSKQLRKLGPKYTTDNNARFPLGGGMLLDLEFLQDETGRRVAAFGYHAGFAGAALAVQAWTWQLKRPGEPMSGVSSYANERLLLHEIRHVLEEGEAKAGRMPRVLVIGALGRCGRGAVELLQKIGIPDSNILKWDLAETSAKSGPYDEIIESDIFINCIYLSDKIPPFLDAQSLEKPGRKLSVICDVSCDTTNPNNPIPVYNINTTFSQPTVPVDVSSDPPLSVISIDHLPSLVPREASEAFSAALLPSLLQLKDWKTARVWKDAEKLFEEKVATLPQGMTNGHASSG